MGIAQRLTSRLCLPIAHGLASFPAALMGGTAGPSVPVFTTQPASLTGYTGDLAQIVSQASGIPDPTYQWYVNNGGGFAAISGATSQTLVINPVELSMNGYSYKVIATNSQGSVESSVAVMTVQNIPVNAILYSTEALILNAEFLTYAG